MPWTITYHDQEPEDPQVGDMWPAPEWIRSDLISRRYETDWADKRPPLVVMLPGNLSPQGERFLIDRAAFGDARKRGWRVQIKEPLPLRHGAQPDITLQPSINCQGSYHGWIRAGVISDDVEGRRY